VATKKTVRVKRYDFVKVEHFGPLYVVDSFRDGSGTVWMGINGDGVSYQFNAYQVERHLTRDEADALAEGCGPKPNAIS
jgi:hypothetical protein